MYPADLSERTFVNRGPEVETRNPFSRGMRYFFYQPRLPCTLLDGKRTIMGSSKDLDELYDIVIGQSPSMIGIVNSPGASLIGEDLDKVNSDIPTVRIDSHDYSSFSYDGYSSTAIKIVDEIAKERKDVRKGTVNIIGLSLLHMRFEDSSDELRRMFSLCGIKVNTVLCAGSSVGEIEDISTAELNVVVDEDYGSEVAKHLKDRFGTPYISIMPIGFQNCEDLINSVCSVMGKDPSAAIDDITGWRKRTAKRIQTLEKRYVRIGGRTFSVHGTPCLTENLAHLMEDYLGLIPCALQSDREIEGFELFGSKVSDDVWDTEVDVVFASGPEVRALIDRHIAVGGVEIREASERPVSIMGRPLFGTMGTVFLMEDVLNILTRTFDRV